MSQRNSRTEKSTYTEKERSNVNNEYCNRYSSSEAVDGAIRMAGFERFVRSLARKAAMENTILSANGAVEFASSGSKLVDFNARATEFRNASEQTISEAALQAYSEEPVDFVKLVFQTGDVRGGKGERHAFNACMDWLVANHPHIANELLELIPEYTRWDHLVRLCLSDNKMVSEHATQIVVSQFCADLKAVSAASEGSTVKISLLAKWMPSLQTKKEVDRCLVRHLLRRLSMQEREYRKALSMLRSHLNVIERALSAKDYEAVDMEKMSSKQQLRYSSLLRRVMEERRHEYIQAVIRGEKKMNASVINPIDIMHEYCGGRWLGYGNGVTLNEDWEMLWSLIPDMMSENGNTLVVRDGSGSMFSPIGPGSSATMIEAATALAIYCSEHQTGAFKDTFITFSNTPQIVNLSKCNTLADKINLLFDYDECSNTDIEATFALILNTALENNLSQDEIPSYLMILSDMEFDMARGAGFRGTDNRNVLFARIRRRWKAAGYEMPTLVFWQLNGKRTIYPEIDPNNGIVFLSGFSANELSLVMAGKYEFYEEVTEEVQEKDKLTGEIRLVKRKKTVKKVLSPEKQLAVKLSDPRYDAVEAAARRGLRCEVS